MSAQGPANTGGILSSARGVAGTGINFPIIGPITIGSVVVVGLGLWLIFGRKGKGKSITIS